MMQPSHLRDGDDLAKFGWLDLPLFGGIPGKRKMSPRLMVVLEVGGEDTDQVGFVEDNDMVQTFAADGADQAFD